MTDPYSGKQSMLRVGGDDRTFRCDNRVGRGEECGSNVFTQHVSKPMRYRCNGCGATYSGESET